MFSSLARVPIVFWLTRISSCFLAVRKGINQSPKSPMQRALSLMFDEGCTTKEGKVCFSFPTPLNECQIFKSGT